mmetsp:Transcript_21868/g.50445  ORF Transcript_21868/g.50445 Transcript_21868/m.50445 type:complete len:120 (-) Transcript_21868:309-668(-)
MMMHTSFQVPTVSFCSMVEVVEIPRLEDDTRRQLFYSAKELVSFRYEAKQEMQEKLWDRIRQKYGEEGLKQIKRRYELIQQAQQQQSQTQQHQQQSQAPSAKRRKLNNDSPLPVQVVAK